MSQHEVTVAWRLSTDDFAYEAYNREHTWTFAGDARVAASAAPEFRGKPGHVDPEAALVAALSSCHMLTFLALASRSRFTVSAYDDRAVGRLEPNETGTLALTRVKLSPEVAFSGARRPSPDEVQRMHERAHEDCFIANSVLTHVTVEPR
jgi:organic hydroperoxide reductase OsmC/OhrA